MSTVMGSVQKHLNDHISMRAGHERDSGMTTCAKPPALLLSSHSPLRHFSFCLSNQKFDQTGIQLRRVTKELNIYLYAN